MLLPIAGARQARARMAARAAGQRRPRSSEGMPARAPRAWDREADVVVLGSGAAALAAAILAADGGSSVLLLEKAAQFGGTTAVSGGIIWAPRNGHMASVGVADSREEALAYIGRLTRGRAPDDALVELFVDTAHQVVDYLEAHTPVRLYPTKTFRDYYAFLPGGKPYGRSLDNLPFAARQLGPWAEKLRRSHSFPPLTVDEAANVDYELLGKRYEDDVRTMGSALAASLFKGLLDRGVEALNFTRARELVVSGAGEAIGVRADREGQDFWAGARQGVVLATGGFEWNRELTRAFLPVEITHPMSPPSNEGDGLLMAMDAGAMLGNMREAWWTPAAADPTVEYDGKPLSQGGIARGVGASLMVNRQGRRFVNEQAMYNDLPKVFFDFDPVAQEYPNLPCWHIFDHSVKSTQMLFTVMPEDSAPDWMAQAGSMAALAGKIGVDAEALVATVRRFNDHAAHGGDPDFHRGEAYFGTSRTTPVLGPQPLRTPPFYAIQVHAGALGTKGGPRTNGNAQVLNTRGDTIPGLYAAGNVAAGVFGPAYPAGGATIAPALVFGYLAGRTVAREARRKI
ncbi:MAG: FAD-dependent oxidoreductase [Dehalococcoidia bacterium]|nr:FAD-dependent oxidoreductase [Dehalococcoidia bacterium]